MWLYGPGPVRPSGHCQVTCRPGTGVVGKTVTARGITCGPDQGRAGLSRTKDGIVEIEAMSGWTQSLGPSLEDSSSIPWAPAILFVVCATVTGAGVGVTFGRIEGGWRWHLVTVGAAAFGSWFAIMILVDLLDATPLALTEGLLVLASGVGLCCVAAQAARRRTRGERPGPRVRQPVRPDVKPPTSGAGPASR